MNEILNLPLYRLNIESVIVELSGIELSKLYMIPVTVKAEGRQLIQHNDDDVMNLLHVS